MFSYKKLYKPTSKFLSVNNISNPSIKNTNALNNKKSYDIISKNNNNNLRVINKKNIQKNCDNEINYNNTITKPTINNNFISNSTYRIVNKKVSDGTNIFTNCISSLEHILTDKNINLFREGIRKNSYKLYDKYINTPEFLFLGRSNVGKSSLINKLLNKSIAKSSKKQGKTQSLEFYLLYNITSNKNISSKIKHNYQIRVNKKELNKHTKNTKSKINLTSNYSNKIKDICFFIDAPGYGYVSGPRILKTKFDYLINTYLHHAIRLKLIVYLINGSYSIQKLDLLTLYKLNKFNIDIVIVFTKLDNFNDKNAIEYITFISNFVKKLNNVRDEIILTSCKTGYGIDNFRGYLYNELDLSNTKINNKNNIKQILSHSNNLDIIDQIDDSSINKSNNHYNQTKYFSDENIEKLINYLEDENLQELENMISYYENLKANLNK